MSDAAVPEYLGHDFKQTSPGLRFGMYMPIWEFTNFQNDGQFRDDNQKIAKDKSPALHQATLLNHSDKALAKAIDLRLSTAFANVPTEAALCLKAKCSAPFTTGLGNGHPLENGFSFLNPYGQPYFPGSGIKGVIRQAARELVSGKWGPTSWTAQPRHLIPGLTPTLKVSDIDVLFGLESNDGSTAQLRGVLSFWDVMPQISADRLMVEVMTPHQSHYYQNKADNRKGAGSTTPHDSGAPNPIYFLTVPPNSGFCFHVVCDVEKLKERAPSLAENSQWKVLITEAFEHAFTWLGFGAKTAVGYGAMTRDIKSEQKDAEELAERRAGEARQARLAQMSPQQKMIDEFITNCEKRQNDSPGKKDKPNTEIHSQARALARTADEGTDWAAEDKKRAAEAILEWLPKIVSVDMRDERRKMKLRILLGEA